MISNNKNVSIICSSFSKTIDCGQILYCPCFIHVTIQISMDANTEGGQGHPGVETPTKWPEWLSAREVVAYAWEKHRYFIKVPKTVRRWKNGDFPVAWQDEEIPSGSRLIFKRVDLDPFLESKKDERRKQGSNSEGGQGYLGVDKDTQGHPRTPKDTLGHPRMDRGTLGWARPPRPHLIFRKSSTSYAQNMKLRKLMFRLKTN